MGKCDCCGTTILFGGVNDQGAKFCSEKCHQQGMALVLAQQIPEELMSDYVRELHSGPCPKCGGEGPIDVHTSYLVWSALFLTSSRSRPEVCCRKCGMKAKLSGMAMSSVAGWWGFPWGIIFTPIQIVRNLFGLVSFPDATAPSPQLEKLARAHLAERLMNASREQPLQE